MGRKWLALAAGLAIAAPAKALSIVDAPSAAHVVCQSKVAGLLKVDLVTRLKPDEYGMPRYRTTATLVRAIRGNEGTIIAVDSEHAPPLDAYYLLVSPHEERGVIDAAADSLNTWFLPVLPDDLATSLISDTATRDRIADILIEKGWISGGINDHGDDGTFYVRSERIMVPCMTTDFCPANESFVELKSLFPYMERLTSLASPCADAIKHDQ